MRQYAQKLGSYAGSPVWDKRCHREVAEVVLRQVDPLSQLSLRMVLSELQGAKAGTLYHAHWAGVDGSGKVMGLVMETTRWGKASWLTPQSTYWRPSVRQILIEEGELKRDVILGFPGKGCCVKKDDATRCGRKGIWVVGSDEYCWDHKQNAVARRRGTEVYYVQRGAPMEAARKFRDTRDLKAQHVQVLRKVGWSR